MPPHIRHKYAHIVIHADTCTHSCARAQTRARARAHCTAYNHQGNLIKSLRQRGADVVYGIAIVVPLAAIFIAKAASVVIELRDARRLAVVECT